MHASVEEIRRLTEVIAHSGRPLTSLHHEVLQYGLLVRGILNRERPTFINQRDIHDSTETMAGDAVSPWHAAACMDDRVRTAAFIRGAVLAVESLLQSTSHRPLHLLEAGCGPLATLVLPLLPYFGSEELQVSIVDIHPESMESALQLLSYLGFQSRIRESLCEDIVDVQLKSAVDLVLTETMYVALTVEPQVSITRSLVRQYPEAILLPGSIRVDLEMIDWAAESRAFPMTVGERIVLGTVFESNATTARELVEEDGRLPGGRIRIPDDSRPGFIPFLTTTVEVFDRVSFANYDAEITCPVPLQQPGMPALVPGDVLHFAYQLGDSPGPVWELQST